MSNELPEPISEIIIERETSCPETLPKCPQHFVLDSTRWMALLCIYNQRRKRVTRPLPRFFRELDHVHIIGVPSPFLVAREVNLSDARGNVWPPRPDRSTLLEDVDTTMHITVDGKCALLWTISRWSRTHEIDMYYRILSFSKEDKDLFCRFLQDLSHLSRELNKSKIISVQGGHDIVIKSDMTWEDLILSDDIIHKTKLDIEGWIANENKYRKLHVPYRRGYLFEGPPGNGKTAVAKVIISTYDFSAYSIDLSNPRNTNGTLFEAFSNAAQNAPAIFLLEDIDRTFSKTGNGNCPITLDGLLNCLDGVANNDGVVVIATANHPEILDPAIRLRPGRFDVPVRFANPTLELRYKYIDFVLGRYEVANISQSCKDKIVNSTEGMSMAFLKALFETAVFSTQGEINNGALLDSLTRLIEYYTGMKTSSERPAGFTANDTSNVHEEQACGEDPLEDLIEPKPSKNDIGFVPTSK